MLGVDVFTVLGEGNGEVADYYGWKDNARD